MRSFVGPAAVIVGLAITVALVLIVFVNLGTRSDIEATRGEIAALRASVEAMDPGVTADELEQQLMELEDGIRNLLIATGGDGGLGGPSGTDGDSGTAIVERLDDILERIDALDARIDEICGNVPVC